MIKTTFAVIIAVIAGGVFFFYTKPNYDALQTTQAQIDQYNTALVKAAQLQQLKQTLLSRYNAFNPNDLDRLQKLLPDHVDNIGLILDMDSVASSYGMSVSNVDVSGGGTAATAQTVTGTIGAVTQPYDSLTIGFTTSGTYDSFIRFLTGLQSSLRIVDLVSLSLVPSSSSGTIQTGYSTSTRSYSYDVVFKTYWLK